MKRKLLIFLFCTITPSLAGCGAFLKILDEIADEKHDDDKDSEMSVCPDGTTVDSMEDCPDNNNHADLDLPDTISGDIVAISPGATWSDAPEELTIKLQVSDPGAVQAQLDRGATFAVHFSTGGEVQSYRVTSYDPVHQEAVRTGADTDHQFELFLTPQARERSAPSIVEVRAGLTSDDEEIEVFSWSWGGATLRFHGDIGNISFEDRESYRLEGVVDPARIWVRDLNRDGKRERIVQDMDAEAGARINVYRCEDGQCKLAGGYEFDDLYRGDDDRINANKIITPDMASDADESEGFLFAYHINSFVDGADFIDLGAEGQSDGADFIDLGAEGQSGMPIRVVHITLTDEGDVNVTKADFNLPANALNFGVHPALVHGGGAGGRIAVHALRANGGDEEEFPGDTLERVIYHESGAMALIEMPNELMGLDADNQAFALGSVGGVCFPGDTLGFPGDTLSFPGDTLGFFPGDTLDGGDKFPGDTLDSSLHGAVVMTFEVDGQPMIAIGSTSNQIMHTFDVMAPPMPGGGGMDFEEIGNISCQYVDLDGDGHSDLVIAVEDAQGQTHLLLSMATPLSPEMDLVQMSAPQPLLENVDAQTWSVFQKDGDVHLHAYTGRNPQTGKEIKIPAKLTLQIENNTASGGKINVEVVNSPPVAPGIMIVDPDNPDTIESFKQGNDKVVRRKPGRTTYENGVSASDISAGQLRHSHQAVLSSGSWLLAQFDGGITFGEGNTLLITGDSKTVVGWLPTTGPFIPFEAPGDDEIGLGLIELFPTRYVFPTRWSEEEENMGATLLNLQQSRESGTRLHMAHLGLVENSPSVMSAQSLEVDLSAATSNASQRNVVKFKAGAELSKSVNAVGSEDCDDLDATIYPGGACSASGKILMVFVLESGEVLVERATTDVTGEIFLEEGREMVMPQPTGYSFPGDTLDELTTLESALWVGSLGDELVVMMRNVGNTEGRIERFAAYAPGDADLGSIRSAANANNLAFGDFFGLGHDQMLALTDSDSYSHDILCYTTHLSVGAEVTSRPDARTDVRHAEAEREEETRDDDSREVSAEERRHATQELCMPSSGDLFVLDVDGDGCDDLVHSSGEAFLSTCDGQFRNEALALGEWYTHISGGDGWEPMGLAAVSHNTSRSNVRGLSGSGDDDVNVLYPFFDALERAEW